MGEVHEDGDELPVEIPTECGAARPRALRSSNAAATPYEAPTLGSPTTPRTPGYRPTTPYETPLSGAAPPPPMTFEQATGAARLDEARRTRAAEVTESERNFVREFTAMMVTGLVVMLRSDDASSPEDARPACVAVNLALKQDRGAPVVEWQVLAQDKRGQVALGEISAIHAEPSPDELGYDLSARSFVVQPKDGAPLLFHAENKDICSLVVDGLQMLMKDHKRRLKKSATKKSHGKKTLGAPPAAKKAPLGNAANVAH